MSGSTVAFVQGTGALEAAAAQQALQNQFVKEQAQAESAVVDLLQSSLEQQKAPLPDGQGQAVDILA